MKAGTVVRWKQYLPANLIDLVGADMATVISRMKLVCTEDGVVTEYNESSGKINVLFPEYGAEQFGLHADCFVEEGEIDLSQPPSQGSNVVESPSWWDRIKGLFL